MLCSVLVRVALPSGRGTGSPAASLNGLSKTYGVQTFNQLLLKHLVSGTEVHQVLFVWCLVNFGLLQGIMDDLVPGLRVTSCRSTRDRLWFEEYHLWFGFIELELPLGGHAPYLVWRGSMCIFPLGRNSFDRLHDLLELLVHFVCHLLEVMFILVFFHSLSCRGLIGLAEAWKVITGEGDLFLPLFGEAKSQVIISCAGVTFLWYTLVLVVRFSFQ